jgi:dihydroorotate dehydrogenase
MYKFIIRKIFFLFSPEKAHYLLFILLKLPFVSIFLKLIYKYDHPSLQRQLFGLTFPNPVGLAAGFDKNGEVVDYLSNLGFGFIEIGTVTPRPQPGNPKPRLFRLPKDQALINRMGFNNEGVEKVAIRLGRKKSKVLIGGNIGKNKDTPNPEAIHDYETCFKALYDMVDYFVVNVSSPNTPGLRELQEKEPLRKLLSRLKSLNNSMPGQKPILLKIAPDLSDAQLDDIIRIIKETGIEGVIAANTTVNRENLTTPKTEIGQIGEGGLSGKPLRDRSIEVIRYLFEKSQGSFPIVGVGGIHSPEDAIKKLRAGASLVQIYTGMIYEGPALVKNVKKRIVEERLRADE